MNEDSIAVMIPIFGIVFGIGVAVVSIITSHLNKVKRHELRHKERLAAMERGLELPPELDENDDKERPRPLLKGMILLAVGAGLYFPLRAVAGGGVEMFAFIPGGIGVAYLLYYFIAGRKEEDQDALQSTRQP